MTLRPLIFGIRHFLSSRDCRHFKKPDIRVTDGLLVRQRALSLRLFCGLVTEIRFLARGDERVSRNFWLRISMDRISDSDSEDAGSIPAGATFFKSSGGKYWSIAK